MFFIIIISSFQVVPLYHDPHRWITDFVTGRTTYILLYYLLLANVGELSSWLMQLSWQPFKGQPGKGDNFLTLRSHLYDLFCPTSITDLFSISY